MARISNDKLFVALRIRGNIDETGDWMQEGQYVDINITKTEATRIRDFLNQLLENSNAKDSIYPIKPRLS